MRRTRLGGGTIRFVILVIEGKRNNVYRGCLTPVKLSVLLMSVKEVHVEQQ